MASIRQQSPETALDPDNMPQILYNIMEMGTNNVAFGFLSFFSGALGLDLGLEKAGLNPIMLNEFDPIACQTIRLNRKNIRLYDVDIRELTATRIMQECGLAAGDPFLVCGGPPCQAFSTAGHRLGLNDERGNVFLHFISLIGEIRPKYVVIENVRGLLSAPLIHRPLNKRGVGNPPLSQDERPGGALRYIISKLKDCGYSISFNLYSTANFGVPQIRERVVIFGSRDGGGTVPDLVPTHDEKARYGLPPWHTFREAVSGLSGPLHHLEFPERRLGFYRLLGPGQNWRDLPEELQKQAMGKSYFAGGGKTGFYRRLAWDKPSPTLVTCPTMPATDLAHPGEDRPLAVEEYARIQTFPDGWQFAGNINDQYRQIGNAVPVEFGVAIGKHLLAYDQGLLPSGESNRIALSRYRNTSHHDWLRSVGRDSQGSQIAMI